MEIAQNPLVQQALYEEIKDFNFEADNVMERIHQLKYLEIVLKETFRLHPVIASVLRETIKDVEIMGYQVPKGTPIFTNTRALHRDPQYYKEPTSFLPERWNEEPINLNAYLPFGLGQHACIGQKMAMLEIKVALICMLKKFKFSMREGQDLKFSHTVTYSVNNLMITINERH